MSTKSEHSDDDVLMQQYARGDAAAFQQLYERHERRIYAFCLRYLGDPDAAADAFQDVFVRVVDASRRYEGRGRFVSWIFTIARRVCLDRVRSTRPTKSLEDAENHYEAIAAADPTDRIASRDELRRLLESLPTEQREVLLLNRYHGFTYGEIAEMIDSSEAAVKQKAYRALVSLRALRSSPPPDSDT